MRNVEIKARCTQPHQEVIRHILSQKGNDVSFKGVDRQTDTYFKVPNGRLKLRSGDIENCLIQYARPDQAGPKESKYILVKTEPGSYMKEALTNAIGVLVEVKKTREIYYLENVKIHLDTIRGLGHFVEIEARDEQEITTVEFLREQCQALMIEFGITDDDLITHSYSDMLLDASCERHEEMGA